MTETVATARGSDALLDTDGSPASTRWLLTELWQARQLVVTLARREFFSRYRRATLGVVWAIILPLLQAFVLAVVFTRVGRINLPGNAFVFVFSGMAGWAFFSTGLGTGATAIVDQAQLASKIYFPRLVLPMVSAMSNAYVAIVNIVILVIAAAVAGTSLNVSLLYLAPGLALLVALTVVASALLASLHVYFRDVRYLVQAGLVLAFYLTPIFYPLDRAPTSLRRVVEVNPMTGVVELYRAATVGADANWGTDVLVTVAWLAALSVATIWMYRHRERTLADLL